MILEAVLLGLSTGTYCAMYCGPVLIPFLFGTEKISCRRNAGLIGLFLASRLAIYFVLGVALSAAGLLASEFLDPYFARRLSVCAYIFLWSEFAFKFIRCKISLGKRWLQMRWLKKTRK